MRGIWIFALIVIVIGFILKRNQTADSTGTDFTGLTPQRNLYGTSTGLY